MTGNFSVLQEGSTLIKDHKKAVDALSDIAGATSTDEAKAIAAKVLVELGELPSPNASQAGAAIQNRDPK